MDENLISKKELLDITGISYGALYRWKRKNLIPDEWFIRKSTFTGQETFFPRDKILARIEKIKNMKEDLSLDDLADVFSPNMASVTMSREELIKRNIVTPTALDLCLQQYGSMDAFLFENILFLYVLDKALQSGDVSIDEGKLLLGTLTENYQKYGGKNCELVFLRKMGVSTCFLHGSQCEFYFEAGARIVLRIDIGESVEELKIRIG